MPSWNSAFRVGIDLFSISCALFLLCGYGFFALHLDWRANVSAALPNHPEVREECASHSAAAVQGATLLQRTRNVSRRYLPESVVAVASAWRGDMMDTLEETWHDRLHRNRTATLTSMGREDGAQRMEPGIHHSLALNSVVIVVLVILSVAGIIELHSKISKIGREDEGGTPNSAFTSPSSSMQPGEVSSGNRRSRRPVLATFVGQTVSQEKGEHDKTSYLMVFNVRDAAITPVNGLEQAKAVFHKVSGREFVTEDVLKRRFTDNMPFEEYASQVRRLMAETFVGRSYGLQLDAFLSKHQDQVFWRLNLPAEAAEQYAAHYKYHVALNDFAYETAEQTAPVNNLGDTVYAYVAYMCQHKADFQALSDNDRLKLLFYRINRHVDLYALESQKVLSMHFVPHDLEAMKPLRRWADLRRWYRFPDSLALESDLRAYFGEQVLWLFVWMRFYMVALMFPAFVGGVVYFRKFFFPNAVHAPIEIGFACVLSIWAAIFNARYSRYEARLGQSWGLLLSDKSTVRTRGDFDPSLKGSNRVRAFHVLGDSLTVFMVIVSMLGNEIVNTLLDRVAWHEIRYAMHVQSEISALASATLILLIDWFWQILSYYIVTWENHRLFQSWVDAWIKRVFFVRIFNNLYPFLYVAFLKEFTATGCPKTPRGCLDQLDVNLIVYFVLRVLKAAGRDLAYFAYEWVFVSHGNLATSEASMKHKNLQVQSKLLPYDDFMAMDDWCRMITLFLFLLCFNVVLPSIACLILLTTMIEARCMAYRNCFLLQRPLPCGATGIGVWHDILAIIEHIGVVVNVSFAVFLLEPARSLSLRNKFLLFVGTENAVNLAKVLLKAKLQAVPRDVHEIADKAKEFCAQKFIDAYGSDAIDVPATKLPPEL